MSKPKPTDSAACFVASFLLQLFSFVVPARRRSDWLREWSGELWQAHDAGWSCQARLGFVAGALPDALGFRTQFREEPSLRAVPAPQCILALAALATVFTVAAFSSPRVRAEFRQRGWHSPDGITILFLSNAGNEAVPTITPDRFELWKERAHYLQAIGFYQVEERKIRVQGASIWLRIAHGTSNLGSLVGESDSFPNSQNVSPGGLVLSRRTWRQAFPLRQLCRGQVTQPWRPFFENLPCHRFGGCSFTRCLRRVAVR